MNYYFYSVSLHFFLSLRCVHTFIINSAVMYMYNFHFLLQVRLSCGIGAVAHGPLHGHAVFANITTYRAGG